MYLIAGARRRPAQIHSLAQPCQGTIARTVVGLALAYDLFKASGE
jgi:hypothetical protein